MRKNCEMAFLSDTVRIRGKVGFDLCLIGKLLIDEIVVCCAALPSLHACVKDNIQCWLSVTLERDSSTVYLTPCYLTYSHERLPAIATVPTNGISTFEELLSIIEPKINKKTTKFR